jgi:integrase
MCIHFVSTLKVNFISLSTMALAIGIWNGIDMAKKANGQGYTFKVGSSFRTVIKHNGYVVTAMARTAQDSRQLAKAKLAQLPSIKRSQDSENLEKIKLADYLLEWLDNEHKHNIAHSTYKRYRSLSVNHINPLIGSYQIGKLTPKIINWLLSQMRSSGQSVRSLQQARALLSIALGEAENLGSIQSNPVRKVKNPQLAERQISPLTLEEVKRLLNTYEGTYLSARLHLALICGLRQGEALGLCWKDVDLETGLIQIRTQIQIIDGKQSFSSLKTERSRRSLVLTESTRKAFIAHKSLVEEMFIKSDGNWQDWDLVFPRNNGTPRSAQTDYDEWQKALKLCGVAPKRLHDARHTAATLMYSQGIGIETISRTLGHSSSAITSRLYVHSAEEPLRNASQLMNLILKN